MIIFLTGATGFVGRNTLDKLLQKDVKIKVLVRNPNKLERILENITPKSYLKNIQVINGDITTPESYSDHLEGVDTVINLVGIIREFPRKRITFWKHHFEATKNLVDHSLKHGVKRFIQMSALGVSIKTISQYYTTKYKAERYVIESFDNWIILRPSIIIGPDGEFTKMIYSMIRLGVVPIIGDGNYLIRPISITTLSNFISYIATDTSINKKEFNLVGPREYTYNEFIDTFALSLGKKNYSKIYLPVSLVKSIARLLGRFRFFPVTLEQINMLLAGNTYYLDILEKLPIKNIPIEEEIKKLRYRK
ncbi:MAG: NAD(P)H-binding protein [Brevinematales bacterium]|nr:NAD(P)H-binding protein [Brevinematales bacterium]